MTTTDREAAGWTPPRWLALAAAALAVALTVVAAVFAILRSDVTKTASCVPEIVFPIVGLIITRVQPRSVVAWTFLGRGVLQAFNDCGETVGKYGLQHGWSEAVTRPALYLTVLWFPSFLLPLAVGLAHFPDGRLPGRWWRRFDVAAIALMVWWTVLIGVGAWGVPANQLASNSEPVVHGLRKVLFVAGSAALPLIVPSVLAAVLSLVLRWRRSAAVQRLQIRWVAIAGLVAFAAELAVDVIGVNDTTQTVAESSGFGLIAIATGFAITRYHLYDIDRILSRTVAYAVITVLLGATYLGLASLGAAVIPSRYGSLGTAGATLAVAALFVPVRRRLRERIDRRFNRARYDAARTIDAFASSLRADLDERQLTGQLLATVQRVVEPAHMSVWTVPRREGSNPIVSG